MFHAKLDCSTMQDKHHLINFRLKSQQVRSLSYFDNVMCQTIKSSGFPEWEQISWNSEK